MHIDLIGWDIGGAHLKAAGYNSISNRFECICQKATPLWLGLDCLHAAIDAILDEMDIKADCKHVITMTGELADCFENREQGVFQLIAAFERHAPVQWVFAGLKGFLDKADSEHIADIASANWLATGFYAASQIQNALLIDIGSSTSDFMPIRSGTLSVRGHTDHQRMLFDELVYTGIVRTSLMALSQRAPFNGAWTNIMAEHFATTADVYRLCDELPEGCDLMPAADGQDKSLEASARRIARLLGLDLHAADFQAWVGLAHYFREQQLIQLRNACEIQISFNHLDADAPLVGAGVGRFLVKELALRFKRPYIDFIDLFQQQDPNLSDCAPAVSLALLAHQRLSSA